MIYPSLVPKLELGNQGGNQKTSTVHNGQGRLSPLNFPFPLS